MSAVADSTPLIYLSWLQDFYLLERLFGAVTIPPAVYREVVLEGRGLPGAAEVRRAEGDWLAVAEEPQAEQVAQIMQHHGIEEGESQAIVLSLAIAAEVVLLDDKRAVKVARQAGLQVVRTTAIYVAAKRLGLVPSVRDKLDQFRSIGFRLSEADYQAVLRLSGE